ncbi:MAG: FAD-binding protein [Pseudomonadota bacterium]
MEHTAPSDERDLVDVLAQAVAGDRKVAVSGGQSHTGFGRPFADDIALATTSMSGVIDYDPEELLLCARAGTPLIEIEALLRDNNQRLGFEPFDRAPLYGRPAGSATLGGAIASGSVASAGFARGGPRDHLLGFRAVSGRAEAFSAGGRVTKNVTGYDLPKLACGSWGRIFVLTELYLRVYPVPDYEATFILTGLQPAEALRAMSLGLRSAAGVEAAAHRPSNALAAVTVTAFRLSGASQAVTDAKAMVLQRAIGSGQLLDRIDGDDASDFWQGINFAERMDGDLPLWRAAIPANSCVALLSSLGLLSSGDWILDWGGGQIWFASDMRHEKIRAITAEHGGHAMLMRAPAKQRKLCPPFHPQPAGLAALEQRVLRAFDPAAIFDTGRF